MGQRMDRVQLRLVKVEIVHNMASRQNQDVPLRHRKAVLYDDGKLVRECALPNRENPLIRITEYAAGFAMGIALRHVAKIRIISVALHCVTGVAKRLKIADVVRSAMLAWDDVIDFERALFCRHATEFTTEFRALQHLIFQGPGESAARFSPVIPDPLATRRQVVIDLYFAERDQFLDFRMGKIVDTLERESGYPDQEPLLPVSLRLGLFHDWARCCDRDRSKPRPSRSLCQSAA